MKWKISFRNMVSLIILIVSTACSNPNTNPNTNPTPNLGDTQVPAETLAGETLDLNTPTAVAPATGNPLCTTTYFPVREGATWSYQSTGSPAGNYNFTDTITSIREDGFTLTSDFDGLTRTQEWDCQSDGLVALQLGGPTAATLNSQEMLLQLEARNVTGVSFPSAIAAGDQWQHTLEFDGQMDMAGQSGEAQGATQTNYHATGTENVSVPAGTFDAMKIQMDTVVTITVNYQGLNVPVTFRGTYLYWFAPNVGWVKAVGNGDIAGQSFTENIELQWYNIP
jgi:hypothetical protein